MLLKVRRHCVVKPVPRPFSPFDEASCMTEPARRADGRGIAMLGSIPLEDRPIDVRFLSPAARPSLAIVTVDLWTTQHPARERTRMRHLVAARVEAAPTPRVVCMPGVGVEHVERACLIVRIAPHHEAGVGHVASGQRVMGGKCDEVKPRPPARGDRERDADRPSTPLRIGIGRCFEVRARNAGRTPHELAGCAPALDAHVVSSAACRDMQRDAITVPVAEPPAVPLDVVVERLVVGHLLHPFLFRLVVAEYGYEP